MSASTVIVDGQVVQVETVTVEPASSQVQVLAEQQAQAVAVEVEPGYVQITVPGPFGTRIYVGPNPPCDTAALWLDTRGEQ